MSRNNHKEPDKMSGPTGSSRKTLTIGIAIVVICIAGIACFVYLTNPAQGFTGKTSANASEAFSTAGELYSQSVDLANTGNYQAALEKADAALAQNVSSLTPLIQSNRAGILVMLGRNDEAIAAADVAINAPGNLTSLRSIAWYNKGNALSALGRTAEADAAYANATALDPTLKHP